MLPKDLVKRIRRIEIHTRRAVNDALAGQYHSVFKGRGMAFAEVRQYQPGDEIRTIDWNVTARMREPYVKVFTEERELTVMLLVDLSASGDFGSVDKSKNEVAAEIAALLAFSAIQNNDRVGAILFTDEVERLIPPKKGRKHVLRLITEILTFRPQHRGTDLAGALEYHQRVMHRSSVTFLISDFLDEGWEKALRLCARRHDLIPVVLRDPWEEHLPAVGMVLAEDAETGVPMVLDTGSPRLRKAYAALQHRYRLRLAHEFKRLDLDHVEVRTDHDYVGPLVAFFRSRARRRAA
ncbi:MAG: DUF58 domain-containing protein [Deltaproteobacteria bacterium]|nr:MAG: DUF58 domain-containing protein [Deltaproteobacteria bacterium]